MSRARPFLLVLVVVLAVPCVLWMGGGVLSAQTPSAEVRPVYQYVGVEQTVARIEISSGKIEVLSQRGSPKSSLLTEQQRPWQWREIRVRDKSQSASGGAFRNGR